MNRFPARNLSGHHIGQTVRGRIVYPFSGPILVTGRLMRVEHRNDGTQVVIAGTMGPTAVPLGLDDDIELDQERTGGVAPRHHT